MVADIKITANTIDVSNFIERTKQKIPSQIQMGLARASAFGIKQVTDKTQKGQLPDGGRLRPYKKSTKKSRSKRGSSVGHVDLTDSGRMFRSLTSKITKSKGTLFFRRNEENKKAFFHDTGTRFMEARPFFAIGRRDEDKIRDIFFKAIKI
jgi:phage gpG-like protein